MTVDYTRRIHLTPDRSTIYTYHALNGLPDACPICSYSISPTFILTYTKNSSYVELLCGCPRNDCASLFFAVYTKKLNMGERNLYYKHSYPLSKVKKKFPMEITGLSADFVAIFNQAHHAEQEGLDLISGVAYRKALEYLIKDYAIAINPEDESKIKRMPLIQVIQQFITESNIRQMSERATWSGNDETHYVRKWEDRDVRDLKNLIDLTVYFISMSLKASKYQEEMAEGRK